MSRINVTTNTLKKLKERLKAELLKPDGQRIYLEDGEVRLFIEILNDFIKRRTQDLKYKENI